MGKRRTPIVSGGEPDHSKRLRHAVPVATLDLHGFKTEQARQRLRGFLERGARQHSGQPILVITGKGSRSPDGPRLRPMVLEELASQDEVVAEWELSLDRGSVFVRLR